MSKKNFKNTGIDLFFSDPSSAATDTLDTQDMKDTLDTQDTSGTYKQKKEYYRLNLKLDMELKEYITDAAWYDRVTVTEYLNTLIRADRDKAARW